MDETIHFFCQKCYVFFSHFVYYVMCLCVYRFVRTSNIQFNYFVGFSYSLLNAANLRNFAMIFIKFVKTTHDVKLLADRI